ncbi:MULTISPECIES: phosphoribosylpyrophosphate synthetase [Nonlabens]|uniref:phosphoribosylpyrophosphate synthetase n=1 Tax=Nonlabens TaxID=363408 RepID=UPI000CF4B6AD|nr:MULTISPECIES: phosphoribosylpyrophosphate synthetase [Nonlabens]PQJ14240.1 phosphoribosylpyrophosphate synthetase [Nonlabens tegetincola]
MKKSYDTVVEATQDLKDRGFSIDFDLVEDGVHSKELKKEWKAGELEVVEFHRFEGMTNPGDNMILYAIETKDDQKGILLDAYGADIEISREMIEKLRMNE